MGTIFDLLNLNFYIHFSTFFLFVYHIFLFFYNYYKEMHKFSNLYLLPRFHNHYCLNFKTVSIILFLVNILLKN